MAKLKLGSIVDDKSVKLTVELPAALHRDLLAYAEVLARETGQGIAEPTKLIAPMLARFIRSQDKSRDPQGCSGLPIHRCASAGGLFLNTERAVTQGRKRGPAIRDGHQV
jgi:hypothetical protein